MEPAEARPWESPGVLRARLTTIRFGMRDLVWGGKTRRVLQVMESVLKDSSFLTKTSGMINFVMTELQGWPRRVWGMPRSAELGEGGGCQLFLCSTTNFRKRMMSETETVQKRYRW